MEVYWSIEASNTELDIQLDPISFEDENIKELKIDLSRLSQFHGNLPKNNIIRLELGNQEGTQEIDGIEQIQTTATSVIILTAVVNFSLGYSLSSLWGMINGI